jgi:pimeloyl-ACP methyl ester carboxylesterase
LLIDRFEQVIVISHSQGGQFAFEAATSRPGRISAICAIEPSGFTNTLEALHGLPVLLIQGDFLDCDERWQQMIALWQAWVDALAGPSGNSATTRLSLPREGIPCNSQMVMMDDNSDAVLECVVEWLERVRPR